MNIVIVDDDKLVAQSLKIILESTGNIHVLAFGENGEAAIELYKNYKPDIMLMDIRMSGISGLEAAENILNYDKNARILFLTTFPDDDYIVKSLQIGAKGYILKQDFEGIAPALEAVIKGQSVFGEKIVTKLPILMKQNLEFNYKSYGITKKEFDIITLVSEGLSNKEISTELFLSEGTVRNYISGILEKLNLRDRTQLAVFYYTNTNK